MAALLSLPLMLHEAPDVSGPQPLCCTAFLDLTAEEPAAATSWRRNLMAMQPHGDAAQLAVNAGNIFLSPKSDL